MPPNSCQQTAIQDDGALRLSLRGDVVIMAALQHDQVPCPTRGYEYTRRHQGWTRYHGPYAGWDQAGVGV